ncbi:Nuclear aminoacylation-dependent tRNA export pathway component [Tilletia horrida]|uniref:Nuclear aminoacylation-dependent tRNA export pathway component n=1 Tax=Tilletia horrida TaxID=155126 RepID=A0AAN6JRX3_9BASI|nr:Nuclear aminoacylation-dependent tRNA export pathway component [Tilletia horrida]KAK0560120.1 Nuclear aminoacylation-dependent tRNA export pathway component [Tilletia horrida]
MDFLKSVSSAVLSKATGPLPNVSIEDIDLGFEGRTIWTLHKGTKRDDSSPVSVLAFDSLKPINNPRKSLLPLAKNALRKLRTMRHPDVLRLIDSVETPTAVYIAVEPVRPLRSVLESMVGKDDMRAEWVTWGLSKLATAVKFINVDAQSAHGNIRIDSIFVTPAGEWRLGGFDVLSAMNDPAGVLFNMGGIVPDAGQYASPEVKRGGWSILKEMESHALDSYDIGLLVFEAYNNVHPSQIGGGLPPSGRIPSAVYGLAKRLLSVTPKGRMSTSQFLEVGVSDGGFFKENRLQNVSSGMDSFMLSSDSERGALMRMLSESTEAFPPEFLQHKVLPSLLQALSYNPAAQAQQNLSAPTMHAAKILPLVLRLGAPLPEKQWVDTISPAIVKCYGSPDRAMRMALLENLELYSERLSQKVVCDKIWPRLVTGFHDTVAALREATLRSILPLAPKLSDRILNNDLLRYLAKTQIDVEPGIRTNTTVLLGRLSEKLSLNTRRKVLIPAFSRSLKDAFVHARMAGLMALMATADSFEADDLATQVLPAICPALMDKEKIVREQADKGVALFLQRVQAAAATMPETVLPPEGENGSSGFGSSGPMPYAPASKSLAESLMSTAVSSAGGAATALASWAATTAAAKATGGSGGGPPAPVVAVPPASSIPPGQSMTSAGKALYDPWLGNGNGNSDTAEKNGAAAGAEQENDDEQDEEEGDDDLVSRFGPKLSASNSILDLLSDSSPLDDPRPFAFGQVSGGASAGSALRSGSSGPGARAGSSSPGAGGGAWEPMVPVSLGGASRSSNVGADAGARTPSRTGSTLGGTASVNSSNAVGSVGRTPSTRASVLGSPSLASASASSTRAPSPAVAAVAASSAPVSRNGSTAPHHTAASSASTPAPTSPPAPAAPPMTKEEKRAEMERKREERKAKLAQMKNKPRP